MSNPAPPVPLSPDTAAQLSAFARSCKAAARAVSLYPDQHPAIRTTLDRLAEATSQLTQTGPADLQVRQHTLLLGGAAPAKADPAVSELADLLHRHLIGALTVNPGADAGSWCTLLLLLARSPDEVRADGGIARLWATAGGPSLEIREVNYAEVLRERRGTGATLDEIITAALDGAVLDDDSIEALLAVLRDPERIDEFMAQLDRLAKERGGQAKTSAVLAVLQALAARATDMPPEERDTTFRHLARMTSRLTPDEMLQLFAREPSGQPVVAPVVQQMADEDVVSFVAGSVIAEGGATARLAQAFQALVPDPDRQRRLLALAEPQVESSPLGADATFEELWGRVESMVTSYSDENYVSEDYGRELWIAQTKAIEVEQASDDPPARVAAWLATVNDTALRSLDLQVLQDLLTIEPDAARWRDIAKTAAAHADDLVRVGHFEPAWVLVDVVVREAQTNAARGERLGEVLERFGRGSFLKHVAAHLRSADDASFARFERLCQAIGTPVIAPLAEALSTEQDARSRRRLRDVLVSFGAKGRDVVQQLMNAPNWEVRRTAAFLLREFGGSEGLKELIPLLTDTEPLVQREAVQGLVLNGSEEAAALLVQALDTVTGRAKQTLVAELSGIRDARASSLFCYLVTHLNRARHSQVYLTSIETLGVLAAPEAVEPLARALQSGEWWAPMRTRRSRTAAAASLKRIGTPEAMNALQAAATRGGRGTRVAAREHLAENQ